MNAAEGDCRHEIKPVSEYLGHRSRVNLKISQKAIILHTLGVVVEIVGITEYAGVFRAIHIFGTSQVRETKAQQRRAMALLKA